VRISNEIILNILRNDLFVNMLNDINDSNIKHLMYKPENE